MSIRISPLWAALLARRLRSYGPNLLLILPATDRAIALTRAIAHLRECWIIKGQIFDSLNAADPLLEYLRTPAEIVRLTSGNSALTRPVISFPELIVGDGPSFVQTRFLDQPHYFSTIEPLLVARHEPRVVSVSSVLGGRAYRLRGVEQQSGTLLSVLDSLLRPIESEAALQPDDWRAKHSLAAKTQVGFAASLREDCRDLEALLRIMLLRETGNEQDIRDLLEKITSYIQKNEAAFTR